MARAGVEVKPPWRRVPQPVRRKVAEALGAPVARAQRVWGGYAPTPTFRLALAVGRRAFFKDTNHTSNDSSRYALAVEERAGLVADVFRGSRLAARHPWLAAPGPRASCYEF